MNKKNKNTHAAMRSETFRVRHAAIRSRAFENQKRHVDIRNNNIYPMLSTIQISAAKITTWLINFEKKHGDTFIVLTTK